VTAASAPSDEAVSAAARRLAGAIEPVAAQVYFAPECHDGYAALGFGPSPFKTDTGVHVPDGPAYFTSRGSVMGQVPGEVVAAAFGVFDPAIVVPGVTHGRRHDRGCSDRRRPRPAHSHPRGRA